MLQRTVIMGGGVGGVIVEDGPVIMNADIVESWEAKLSVTAIGPQVLNAHPFSPFDPFIFLTCCILFSSRL